MCATGWMHRRGMIRITNGAGSRPLAITHRRSSLALHLSSCAAAAELALPPPPLPPPLVSSPTAAPNYQLLSPSGAINKVQLTSICVQRPCDGIHNMLLDVYIIHIQRTCSREQCILWVKSLTFNQNTTKFTSSV